MNPDRRQRRKWTVPVALSGAILLGGATPGRGEVVLDPPRPLRLELRDGSSVRLEVRKLDREALHGSDGRVGWADLPLPRIRALWLRFLDRREGEQWLDAAWVIMVHPEWTPGDESFARRLLEEARRRLPQGEARIVDFREDVRRRRQADRRIQSASRGTETVNWSATPWSPPGPGELDRREARLEQRLEDRLEVLEADPSGGPLLHTVRSQHAIIASSRPRADAAGLGLAVDEVIRDLNRTFGTTADHRLFAPRLGVLIVDGSTPGKTRLEISGEDDGDLLIVMPAHAARPPRTDLRHELVHAWMHRYRSPVRPPAWFNEGLAHAVAWWRVPAEAQDWRPAAVALLRTPGILARLQSSTAQSLDPEMTAAAGLLVHRLLEERRSAIGRWLVEVKGGRSATDAWQEVFGESLVETAQRPLAFWRIND